MRISRRIKSLALAGALAVAGVAPAIAPQVASAARTPELGVVAPAEYSRPEGKTGIWAKNFRIIGTYKGEVNVGVSFDKTTTNDWFSLPAHEGLTLNYGYYKWDRVQSIAFKGTIANANKALASMTLDTGRPGKNAMKVLVTKDDLGYVFAPSNGHFYKFVAAPAITNSDAAAAARKLIFRGVSGYLATVTSSVENDFVGVSIQGARNVWIDGADNANEGEWKFTGGPEKGRIFFKLTCATKAKDSADSCTGANSVVSNGNGSTKYSTATSAAVAKKTYASWETDEPNNWGTDENFIATNWQGTVGKWNDLADSTSSITGYVAEFSGIKGGAAPKVFSATGVLNKTKSSYYVTNVKVRRETFSDRVVDTISWKAPRDGSPTYYRVTREVRGQPLWRLVCYTKNLSCKSSLQAVHAVYTVSAYYRRAPLSYSGMDFFSTKQGLSIS